MKRLWLNLALPFILLMSATICDADDISLRIKALGSELAGIITDKETDILQNPARLVELDSIQLFSTFKPGASRIGRYRYDHAYVGDTLALVGLFPRTISPKIGIGFIVRGAHRKTSYERYYPEDLSYWYELQKYRGWSNYNEFSSNYCPTIFNSIRLSQKASIGFSYSYSTSSYSRFWNRHYQHQYLDLFTLDTIEVRKSSYKENTKDDTKAHIFRIGSMFGFGTKTNIEVIGEIVASRRDSPYSMSHIDSYSREREYYYAYSDSSYKYRYDNYNRYSQNSEQSTPLLNSKMYSFDLRLSQRVSQNTKLHLITSIDIGRGKLSGDSESDILSIREEHSSFTYYSPETTYTHVYHDTLHLRVQDSSVISGRKHFLLTSITIGAEIKLSENAMLGFALKGIWSKDEVDRSEVVTQSLRIDTTAAGVATTADTTYAVTGKVKKISRHLFIPFGLEYKLNSSTYLRFGICPQMNLEKYETEGELDYPITVTEGLPIGYSFGLGYRLSNKLSFDLFNNGDLTKLSSWELEVRLTF